MKKSFILTLLVFSTAASFYAHPVSIKEKLFPPHFRKILAMHFVFASPSNYCERPPGICFINKSSGSISGSYTGCEADGTGYFENGILYIEVPKNQIGLAALNALSSRMEIPVEQELQLNAETTIALQADRPIILKKGIYPIRDNGTSLQIAFTCR